LLALVAYSDDSGGIDAQVGRKVSARHPGENLRVQEVPDAGYDRDWQEKETNRTGSFGCLTGGSEEYCFSQGQVR
jgi:hypothetical protein